MDIKIADFDGVVYQIVVDKSKKDTMHVNLFMKDFTTLHKSGADKVMLGDYKQYRTDRPKNNADLTLEIDAAAVKDVDAVADLMGLLKRNLVGAPFKEAFNALQSGSSAGLKPTVLQIRDSEQMIVAPLGDRVNVAMSIDMQEATDFALAEQILDTIAKAAGQESNAPNVKFTKDVPAELKGISNIYSGSSTVGFLVFTVYKTHVDGGKMDKVINLLLGLRHYVHYHIKASKAHLHQRMRAKVKYFLQILNRARPDSQKTVKKFREVNL